MWKPTFPPAKVYKKENLSEIAQFSQFIYTVGEYPKLRQKSKAVAVKNIDSEEFDAKKAYLRKCFDDFRSITHGKGKGIAAVQIGIPERFFLLSLAEDTNPPLLFINPVITRKSKTMYQYPEACMSANSLIAQVVRPSWIEFEYLTENGEKCFWRIKDKTAKDKMLNRIVQHEIDHLNGIINIDKVSASSLVFEMGTEYYGKARFKKVSKK